MLKRVDVAVYDYINASAAGDLSTLPEVFDLKRGRRRLRHHRRPRRRHRHRSSTPTRPRSSTVRSGAEHAVTCMARAGTRRGPGPSTRSRAGGGMAESGGSGGEYAVELVGITKRFPGVVANDDIHLRVRRGEVHALCGENGAGKSTLMKILYGMQQPDEGTIRVNGAEVHVPLARRRHQGRHRHGAPALHARRQPHGRRERAARRRGRARHRRAGPAPGSPSWPASWACAPSRTCCSSGSAWRTGSAWRSSRCSTAGARTVILDEPTAVLVPQEVDELFATLRGMQRRGLHVPVHLAQAGRGARDRRQRSR